MKRYDFNSGWSCRSLSREGEPVSVTLPHDAMLSEPRDRSSQGEGNIGWFIGGDYEYTKNYILPKELEGRKLTLEFEGVMHNPEIWINGEKRGSRAYGYTNFFLDATGLLKAGQSNEIRVISHNSLQPNSRWYSGSGIYRPVWLYAADEDYIPVCGVRIRTKSTDPAQIKVEVRTSRPGPFRAEILDPDDGDRVLSVYTGQSRALDQVPDCELLSGDGVQDYDAARDYRARSRFSMEIPGAKLWSPDEPKLYRCRVSFANDIVEENFGVRSISWDPQKGFCMNGERMIIRGACIHHDNGILGACSFPEAEERRIRILKENGYNAVRSAHNPCSKALLDACDKVGMMMMDEFADAWYIHKTRYDYVLDLANWWRSDLRDMVNKDFNHPCVVLYSTGNEVSETAQERGIAFTKEMTDFLHGMDPTRPVSCGVNIFFNFLSSIGLGVYSDDKAQKQSESAKQNPEKKEKKKHVGSDFYNTLANTMGSWFMKTGATIPPCDWRTRGAFANMDMAGYNYGIFRYKHDLKKYPRRLILGSETFCADAQDFWDFAKDHTRIVGDFVWAGMDYIGECGEGAAEYEVYKTGLPVTGHNGRVDLLGKRRAEAAYTLVALEREKGPFIAVDPVQYDDKPQLSGWQLSEAIETWSFNGCSGRRASVEVYARAASVELFINGRSVGKKAIPKCRAIFDTTYEDGEISAVSYDKNGAEIGRCSLKTAGETTILSIKPESSRAEEGKLIFIPLQYTDEEGTWKPVDKRELKVSVENGELVGLGSACPYMDRNYTGDSVLTYFGEAMAVVRAGKAQEGPVKVCVADGDEIYTKEIPF